MDAGGGQKPPGVFFFYDLSPIKVELVESRKSALTLLTSARAIVKPFASGITTRVYHGGKAIKKKIDPWKQGDERMRCTHEYLRGREKFFSLCRERTGRRRKKGGRTETRAEGGEGWRGGGGRRRVT